jgi:hypothetical protein
LEFRTKVNKNSVSGKLDAAASEIEGEVKDYLKRIADSLIGEDPREGGIGAGSPVDTGAYITSHSFQPTGGRGGRSRSSTNKPKNQSWSQKAEEARSNLYADIEAADVTEERAGIFRNRAPHAAAVESKHLVYAKVKDRFR